MTYLIVTPRYVARRASVPAALALASACERAARAAHGPRAGADCYIVAERSIVALDFRGMACGRRLLGRSFGCGPWIVERARAAISAGLVR